MASVHAHGSHWRVHYQGADGTKRKSPTLGSREAADAWITANLSAATLSTWVALLDAWVAEHPARYRANFSSTWIPKATAQGWKKPQDVTAATLDDWLRASKAARTKATLDGTRKPPAYGAALRYLLALLRWGAKAPRCVPVKPEVLTYSPSRLVRPSKRERPALLTIEQVVEIRSLALGLGERSSAVIRYLLTYAARPITAVRLKRKHLDMDRLELSILEAKSSGSWRHPITKEEAEWWHGLADWTDDPEAPLFPHWRDNRPWRENGSAVELQLWYRANIGKKVDDGPLNGIYNLKRYAITGMLQRGLDPATVALFSGHKTLSQVLTYNTTNAVTARAALSRMSP